MGMNNMKTCTRQETEESMYNNKQEMSLLGIDLKGYYKIAKQIVHN